MTTTTLGQTVGALDGLASSADSTPVISVVIPLLNEEESIPHLYQALTDALDMYGRTYEMIVVDDGSATVALRCSRKLPRKTRA